VVDCPGFNDTRRSDSEILEEIAEVLSTQYLWEKKFQLRGILWLRDITKTRMDGSDVRTLYLFSQLVGRAAFKHVVFVSTMWNRVDAQLDPFVYEREAQLKNGFWGDMIGGGSYPQRFLGTKASAQGILSQLVGGVEPVVLRIQQELVDDEMPLSATAAGSVLALGIEEDIEVRELLVRETRARLATASNTTTRRRLEMDVQNAEKKRGRAGVEKEKLGEKVGLKIKDKIKESLTVRNVCSVLGLSVQIVGAVLPAAGACTVM
jgi:hypothetical protein